MLFLIAAVGILIGTTESRFMISNDPNDIRFLLYSDPSNRDIDAYHEIVFKNESTLQGLLPVGGNVSIFSHGYLNNWRNPNTSQLIKNAFLQSSNPTSIFILDWDKLSNLKNNKTPSLVAYPEAVDNAKLAGERVADFLVWLEGLGLLDQVHLVGNSLGAHLCGFAGRAFHKKSKDKRKVNRISGLDPAGPLLEFPISIKKPLSQKDAEFVDCIHTNAFIYGTFIEDGHANFFVDGGVIQPNCTTDLNCSHLMSVTLFALSFTKEMDGCRCQFPLEELLGAFACVRWCRNKTRMGVFCPTTARGSFYVGVDGMWA